MKGWQDLPEECCGNCKHFCEHYVRMSEKNYVALRFGHCTHPRLKNRRVEEQCRHFTQKED